MDKEAEKRIGAEYKFWTGNCPHPDFTKHIIEIIEALGYHKIEGEPPLLSDEEIEAGKKEAKRLYWTFKVHPLFEKEKFLLEGQREVDMKYYKGSK